MLVAKFTKEYMVKFFKLSVKNKYFQLSET